MINQSRVIVHIDHDKFKLLDLTTDIKSCKSKKLQQKG